MKPCMAGWLPHDRQRCGLSGFQRTKFICVDGEAELVPGTAGNSDGALLYHTRTAGCSNGIDLPCPPYDSEKELTCVVCSK
jgi:hypothetical protein